MAEDAPAAAVAAVAAAETPAGDKEETSAAVAVAAAAEEKKDEEKKKEEKKEEEKKEEEKPLTADTIAAVKRQLEFYFSDSNFSQDKFLREAASKNEEGWVELATLGTFRRLQTLGCTAAKAIASCILDSEDLVVSEDHTKVRRKTPLPADYDPLPRSIYAKGFPLKATVEEIEAVFSPHGKVAAVWRRKERNKTPKPSAFIEMGSVDAAKKVVDLPHKFGEQDLLVMSKEAYIKMKEEERKERQTAGKKRGRGDEGEDGDGFTAGLIMTFEGVADKITRDDLKAKFQESVDRVAFIEFNTGDVSGRVRLFNPEDTLKLIEATNEKQVTGEVTMKSALLAGDEEKEFWEKVKEARKSNKDKHRNKRRRR